MFTDSDFRRLRRMNQIRRLSPSDFEWFSKYLLESLGFQQVTVSQKRGKKGGDGGIDLTAMHDGQRFYAECKRWKFGLDGTDVLPIAIVRALGGCMLRDKVNKGVVITTLRADHRCIVEGGQMGIGIIGAPEIVTAMRKVNPSFRDGKPGLFIRILSGIVGFVRLLITGDAS